MDAMFAKLIEFARPESDKKGWLSEAFSTRLDAFCRALSETSRLVTTALPAQAAAAFLAGLQTAQQIARQAGENNPPQTSGSWSYILEPIPMVGSILTLHRLAPNQVEIGLQFDRKFNLHGLISLILGSGPDQQVFSFDLEHGQAGWMLRRWDDDQQGQFRLEIPAGQIVPWASTAIFGFWDQPLAASLSPQPGELKQAVSSPAAPEPEAPQLAALQTLIGSPSGAPPPAWRLVNQENGLVFTLKSILTLGRGEESDLRLDDREVSRSHAVIEPAVGGWQIRDLNSSNGTWLNDNRVTGTAPLRIGDVLRLGNTRLRLERPPR